MKDNMEITEITEATGKKKICYHYADLPLKDKMNV